MVCDDGTYDGHPWVTVDGCRVCPDCGLVDLTSARLRRDVLRALAERGLLRRLDEPEQPP